MPKLFNEKGVFYLQLAIVLAVTFLASNAIGLFRGGFSAAEILNLQSFYLIGISFAIIIFSAFKYEGSSPEGDKTYGNSVGFASLGEVPHFKFFARFTVPQIFMLFLIIFSVIAMVNISLVQQGFGQRTFTGVGFLEAEQFTPVDSIIYSTLLIPGSENLGAAALVALLIVFLGIFARRRKMQVGTYKTLLLILIVVALLAFGVSNHLLRYRGSEVALVTVAIFWAIGGLLTAVTGSFVPFWVLHIVNNLFFDLSRFFSNESIFIAAILSVFGLIVLYLVIYRGRLAGRSLKNAKQRI